MRCAASRCNPIRATDHSLTNGSSRLSEHPRRGVGSLCSLDGVVCETLAEARISSLPVETFAQHMLPAEITPSPLGDPYIPLVGRWEYSLTRWRRSQNPGLLAKRLPLSGKPLHTPRWQAGILPQSVETFAEPRPVGEETPSLWETLTYPSLAGGNTPSIGGDLRKNPGLLAKRLPLPGERAGVRGILHLSYAVPRDCQSYAKPAPDTDTGVSSERELELAPYLIRRRG